MPASGGPELLRHDPLTACCRYNGARISRRKELGDANAPKRSAEHSCADTFSAGTRRAPFRFRHTHEQAQRRAPFPGTSRRPRLAERIGLASPKASGGRQSAENGAAICSLRKQTRRQRLPRDLAKYAQSVLLG